MDDAAGRGGLAPSRGTHLVPLARPLRRRVRASRSDKKHSRGAAAVWVTRQRKRPAAPVRSDSALRGRGRAGADAWKVKRAVRFPYMDFSSLVLRRAACARELERNQRSAPDIYLGCVPIVRRGDGKLALGGSGEVVEWTVHMRRFEQSALLSNIAAASGIDAVLAKAVADEVFDSHQRAERRVVPSEAAPLAALVASVSRSLATSRFFPALGVARFASLGQDQLSKVAALLDARARQGSVRLCHGDLHLDNIVLWHRRPLLYDAIEFDEAIATIDVLYDLAFLLMDLERHGQRSAANVVLNRYLWRSQDDGDLAGLRAMPLFLGLRAAIRAMVTADRAGAVGGARRDDSSERARPYLASALGYLAPSPPRLIAIGGVSGSGKSTLGAAIAPLCGPAPGALHLRSDLERKAVFAVAETVRLPSEAYANSVSERVYGILCSKARLALAAGHSVVADAVFPTPVARSAIAAVAGEVGVPFQGVWLTAEPAQLASRLAARRNDASDATPEHLATQLARDAGDLAPDWTRVDAGGTTEATRTSVLSALGWDGQCGRCHEA
jgi:aminoglycoside phosphotransferase family enzyme/predicted kinase